MTPRSFIRASCMGLAVLLCGGCGGGGDSGIYPLWVPTDVVVRDVDGDGRADVLTLAMLAPNRSRREGHLVVYRQTSPGHFADPESSVVGIYPWRLGVADLDGDGLADVVITDVDGRTVWLLMQEVGSPGRFGAAQALERNVYAYETAIADLNGDETPDIAIADLSTTARRVLLRYQDPEWPGTFLPGVDVSLPGTASEITAGDIDGNGLTDLFMWVHPPDSPERSRGSLAFSLQQAGAGLGPVTTLAPQRGLNVGRLSIADYDGDRRNDLLVFFTPSSSGYRAKLTVVLQESPAGSFGAPVDTSLAGVRGIDDAAFADLDDDDRPDVAVAGFYPVGSPSEVKSQLNLFRQSRDGAFARAAVYRMPIPVSRVAAGDLDGDGRNDLVVLGADNRCLVQLQSHATPGTFEAPQPLALGGGSAFVVGGE